MKSWRLSSYGAVGRDGRELRGHLLPQRSRVELGPQRQVAVVQVVDVAKVCVGRLGADIGVVVVVVVARPVLVGLARAIWPPPPPSVLAGSWKRRRPQPLNSLTIGARDLAAPLALPPLRLGLQASLLRQQEDAEGRRYVCVFCLTELGDDRLVAVPVVRHAVGVRVAHLLRVLVAALVRPGAQVEQPVPPRRDVLLVRARDVRPLPQAALLVGPAAAGPAPARGDVGAAPMVAPAPHRRLAELLLRHVQLGLALLLLVLPEPARPLVPSPVLHGQSPPAADRLVVVDAVDAVDLVGADRRVAKGHLDRVLVRRVAHDVAVQALDAALLRCLRSLAKKLLLAENSLSTESSGKRRVVHAAVVPIAQLPEHRTRAAGQSRSAAPRGRGSPWCRTRAGPCAPSTP